jgi:hypothetical protein
MLSFRRVMSPLLLYNHTLNEVSEQSWLPRTDDSAAVAETSQLQGDRDDTRIERRGRHAIEDLLDFERRCGPNCA